MAHVFPFGVSGPYLCYYHEAQNVSTFSPGVTQQPSVGRLAIKDPSTSLRSSIWRSLHRRELVSTPPDPSARTQSHVEKMHGRLLEY